MEEEIKVSICCITYNQEKYIGEALDSFLKQKTNFKYEIIVRDDASTDNTANIIREYEEKYPDIIKPIYEKINGRLAGVRQVLNITFEKAVGKYIAICEGDDYWIDENKLQKQIDYMEENKNCALYIHNAYRLNMKNGARKIYNTQKDFYNCKIKSIMNSGDMMLIDFCCNVPTASMFFPRKYISEFPDWYYNAPCGDMPLRFLISTFGYVYYDNTPMSIYRYNTGNSVMDNWSKEKKEEQINRINKFIYLLNEFNKYTNYIYDDDLQKCIKYYEISKLLEEKNFKKIVLNEELRKIYIKKYNDIFLIKIFLKSYFSKFWENLKLKIGRIR